MAHLTLAGLSDDRARLLLVDDNGTQFTLDIDAPLRAALRGDDARIGQLEIQMESALRPRDIQARIRGGETAESVAQAAQTTVEKVMVFAAPVLAERAHVAERAQSSSLRRRSGETGARTLGQAVEVHLQRLNVDPESVEWDAWRREDGRWTLTGVFSTSQRSGEATFSFDMRGNFVTSDDEDARWLVGDAVHPTDTAATPEDPPTRRLSAVPADELPLGEDAIELVADEDDPAETTIELDKVSETAETADPAADEPPARRAAKKSRGRASVPSWDEIMFGGPSD